MPLTPLQREVARLLANNRNPDSHVAGGAVINRGESTLRYSDDLDIFHDVAESVADSAARDADTLLRHGFSVEWSLRREAIQKAVVGRGDDFLRLDWAADSAFRFFPVERDEEFGYCLHRADLATNKILALVGRVEPRDYLDVLELDRSYLSLGALIWAACGKDEGYTPSLMLQMANRHSRHRDADFADERLARAIDAKQLKTQWLEATTKAEALFDRLPPEELGCLYIGRDGEACTPDPNSPTFPGLTRHYGSIRGAWPRFSS